MVDEHPIGRALSSVAFDLGQQPSPDPLAGAWCPSFLQHKDTLTGRPPQAGSHNVLAQWCAHASAAYSRARIFQLWRLMLHVPRRTKRMRAPDRRTIKLGVQSGRLPPAWRLAPPRVLSEARLCQAALVVPPQTAAGPCDEESPPPYHRAERAVYSALAHPVECAPTILHDSRKGQEDRGENKLARMHSPSPPHLASSLGGYYSPRRPPRPSPPPTPPLYLYRRFRLTPSPPPPAPSRSHSPPHPQPAQ